MGNNRGNHEDYGRQYAVETSSERSFGIVFAVVFGIVACWPLMSGGGLRWWALGCAAAFLVAAFAFAAVLRPLNTAWAMLGNVLHHIVNPIIMGILFFGVMLPTGVLMRLFGKDPLRLKFAPNEKSYWIERDPPGPDSHTMQDQF